jgi:hypothetical protein
VHFHLQLDMCCVRSTSIVSVSFRHVLRPAWPIGSGDS